MARNLLIERHYSFTYMKRRNGNQSGFSLIELMIVIVIVGILAAFTFYGIKDKSGGVKKVLSAVDQTLQERKTAAIRLNQANSQGIANLDPVPIDFADGATTAPLRIDGADANRDGIDDNSGETLTRWDAAAAKWNFAYEGKPLALPDGWTVIADTDDLGKTPEIPGSELTTSIQFDEQGRPSAVPTAASGKRKGDEAPFWVIYFRDGQYKRPTVAAIAVHGSGLIEQWTYDRDEGIWLGSGGRE